MRHWIIAALVCCWATAAHATVENQGTQSWLTWSATSVVTDAAPAAINKLFVRYTNTVPLRLKGGEVDITWEPDSDGLGCFDHIGTVYKTSSGTTCTYLNRGSAVPVIVADDVSHFHVAWANTTMLTSCTAGTAIEIDFETDKCADPRGCFRLNYANILGILSYDTAIAGPVVTMSGGGSHSCGLPTPAEPATWGTVKALYTR